jgi:hypothetical protein
MITSDSCKSLSTGSTLRFLFFCLYGSLLWVEKWRRVDRIVLSGFEGQRQERDEVRVV